MLQLVGTDHAVFNSTQKRAGRHDFRLIPNGVNGLEVGGVAGRGRWAHWGCWGAEEGTAARDAHPAHPAARLQERLHVVWQELVNSGLATPSDFVRLTSTQAAQVFNIYPRKGVVSRGEAGHACMRRGW